MLLKKSIYDIELSLKPEIIFSFFIRPKGDRLTGLFFVVLLFT